MDDAYTLEAGQELGSALRGHRGLMPRTGWRSAWTRNGAAAAIAVGLACCPGAPKASGDARRGAAIVTANCASCHAVGKVGDSPVAEAPAFRNLHRRYPVESLAESMAEGISTGHPVMPEFRFEPDQIGDVLAFLKSLEQ